MGPRILVIKMSSLGDIIQAWPVAWALRNRFPNAHITWVVQENFRMLVPGAPYVDEVVTIDRKRLFQWSYFRELRHIFRETSYDILLDLQGILKSSIITLASGAKRKLGYCDAKEGSWLFHERIQGPHCTGHVVERYLDVVRALGADIQMVEYPIPDLTEGWNAAQVLLDRYHVPSSYQAFGIATRWINKDWPSAYFAEFANYLWDKEGTPSLLLGLEKDRKKAQEILALSKPGAVVDLTGQTDLMTMFAIIAHATLFVGGDSGPTHFANACKIPLLALFGVTYPSRSGPYGNPYAKVLVSKTAPPDKGQLANKDSNIMVGLTPDMAVAAYTALRKEQERV